MEELEKFEEYLLLKNLSDKTIKGYVNTILLVSKRIKKDYREIDEHDIKTYVCSNKKRKLSSSSQMSVINSFKSYFKVIKNRSFDHSILPRPKIEQRQPDVLSIEEFQNIINSIINIKHKAIICLMYSCGLRVSEALNVKIKDIDSSNNKLIIRDGKGKIDRIVMLDNSVLNLLRIYWESYKTNNYLFEGSKGDKYSDRSVQKILKTATKIVGINKKISTHSLRHSCFTQLIKNGVDLRTVQKIAGHKNINTTANYIKISDEDVLNTSSPILMIKL
jgi:site-specific recombinase XerD